MFAQEEALLSTKYDILKENHETLQRNYECLKLSSKIENDLKDLMKSDFQNQIKELESRVEKERSEKEKMIEELKNELRFVKEKNEEVLKKIENEVRIVKEKKEEELKKMENEVEILKETKDEEMEKLQNKYDELAENFDEVQKECFDLRSILEEVKDRLIGQEENIVVDHNMKETVTVEILKETKDEEMEKLQNKYDELAENFDEVRKECSKLRSILEEVKNRLFGQVENIVVDHNMKETVTCFMSPTTGRAFDNCVDEMQREEEPRNFLNDEASSSRLSRFGSVLGKQNHTLFESEYENFLASSPSFFNYR